jgi:serine/threonine-protein kinase
MPRAQQLGRYQLLDRIAYGGMAEIFRAKTFDAEGREHLVAVKRVLGHLVTDEQFIKMLVDEAKLTAALQHDNIARVYEFAHTGDEYFIAMEYVDGKDTRSLLERHRQRGVPVPPEHVAWICMEVARALHAAHAQRDAHGRSLAIVHRDVSPSNVLCSYNGEVKLCDFGIAKASSTRVQTKTGVIKGKVKYMSPEQAMGRKLDHRSDLFSLGTCMYELLTLQAPFSAPTEVELIFAVRDAQKRDARSIEKSIPLALNDIVNRLMSRSRSQRFQSGDELAAALRAFLDRHKAGYRRSHFGRFMRGEFAAEIERELRMLEEYVIERADPSAVGENLIADALPADAPYSQFTAASASTTARGDDLHAQPTRILTTSTAAPDRETRIFGAPRPTDDLHEESTRLLDAPDAELLSEMETRILGPRPAPRDADTPPSVVLDDATPPSVARKEPPPLPPPPDDDDESTAVPLGDDDLEPV